MRISGRVRRNLDKKAPIRLALSGQVTQPMARQEFVEFGRKQSLVRLIPGPPPTRTMWTMCCHARFPAGVCQSPEQRLLDKAFASP
jgi:hypothetical protein